MGCRQLCAVAESSYEAISITAILLWRLKLLASLLQTHLYDILWVSQQTVKCKSRVISELINFGMFRLKAPANQPLLEATAEAIQQISGQAGLITTHFHRSLDGARLIMGCGVPKNLGRDECSSSDGWASHGDALTCQQWVSNVASWGSYWISWLIAGTISCTDRFRSIETADWLNKYCAQVGLDLYSCRAPSVSLDWGSCPRANQILDWQLTSYQLVHQFRWEYVLLIASGIPNLISSQLVITSAQWVLPRPTHSPY